MRWHNFVAVGDSFSEGMDDPYPDGTFRGWADLVAARLAVEAGPDFRYANLAIRGRLLPSVIADQLPAALAMRPDLVSFAAGGNDILRRRCDPAVVCDSFHDSVTRIRATGADVIVFRFADITLRLPGQRLVGPRVAYMNARVGETAAETGAHLIDLFVDDEFRNPLLWSVDRLHLSELGHRRTAAHVLTALGVAVDEDWMLVPPHPAPSPWLLARGADLRWAGRYLAPWLKRRLTGRSSGDLISAKRPSLAPVDDRRA